MNLRTLIRQEPGLKENKEESAADLPLFPDHFLGSITQRPVSTFDLM